MGLRERKVKKNCERKTRGNPPEVLIEIWAPDNRYGRVVLEMLTHGYEFDSYVGHRTGGMGLARFVRKA